ncbi:MAG: TonB family protein [Spirochaetes bacterium]|nr:TonB family protein [Spirochaetota bacterium]
MTLKSNTLVYYSLCISVIIHGAFLCISFGKDAMIEQPHNCTVTVKTLTILPRVEDPSDATKLMNNPVQRCNQQAQSGITSQYMISNENNTTVSMQYTDMIRQRIQEALLYPATARKDGIEGQAYVKFTIEKNGNVMGVVLVQSSGSLLLDTAAISAIHSAAPFPPIPDTLNKERITFIQGLTFTLK